MADDKVFTPVLERVFDVIKADGKVDKIYLQISEPYLISEKDGSEVFRCDYKILTSWILPEFIQYAIGRDAIESLWITFLCSINFIKTFSDSYSMKVTWNGDDDLGFPFREYESGDDSLYENNESYRKMFDDFFKNLG